MLPRALVVGDRGAVAGVIVIGSALPVSSMTARFRKASVAALAMRQNSTDPAVIS